MQTDAAGRIPALRLPLPDGSPGTFAAVQYTYDELGNLTTATDAEGHAARYAYAGHLLVHKTFREGTSFYFAYDAPTGRTTVMLRSIRGLAGTVNGLRLLTDQAHYGF